MSAVVDIAPFRAHPVFAAADLVAQLIGSDKDLVQCAEFLSLCAGRMVMPVHLDLQTDHLTVDLHLANRVFDIRYGHVARVDTHRQFRRLEEDDFYLNSSAVIGYDPSPPGSPRPLAAILIRGSHRTLHREVLEYTARMRGKRG